jgi:putative flippase GtrA
VSSRVRELARSPGIQQFVRFALTGVAGFVADFGTLVALHGRLDVVLWFATASAYVVGGVVHYSLTRFWVFAHPLGEGELGKVGRYLALVACNVVLTVVAVVAMTHAGLDYRAAKVITVVTLFFSNYVIVPRWVMPHPRSAS